MNYTAQFPFKPTIQRLNNKRIYGFDIETYDNNKKFYCASIWGEDFKHSFTSKDNLITALKSSFFKDTIIVATNLSFDFFGLLFGKDEILNFKTLFRGSDLLIAKTYIYNNKFNSKYNKHKCSLTFLDTLNYAKLSVKQLGQLINCPKLETPDYIGKKPKNKQQHDYLLKYNLRDSEVSCKGLKFLYKGFEDLGATCKMTIASTSMSLFRNKYLDQNFYTHNTEILLEQFKGYYGGRTEAFKRGKIKDYNYYDFNSLYPSVMLNQYPNPNTLRINTINSDKYINRYDGMSHVTLISPNIRYPLLPVRYNKKLVFPTGLIKGYYTHIELRQAFKLGYKLIKVHKCFYYLQNVEPFNNFVTELYNLRRTYQKQNNQPMSQITKILLNSNYGKFAQTFLDKDNLIPNNLSLEDLNKLKWFEFSKCGNYIRVKKDCPPAVFCIPIWASYVTAYARLKLHNALIESNAVYCDTDSIITKKKMPTSNDLGDLKLEHYIKDGIIVKPKFYYINDDNNKQIIKSKGIGKKLVFSDFHNILLSGKISYTKFVKFKESLRRGLIPNEIIEVMKQLNLEDNKRVWLKEFNNNELQDSQPLNLTSDDYIENEK